MDRFNDFGETAFCIPSGINCFTRFKWYYCFDACSIEENGIHLLLGELGSPNFCRGTIAYLAPFTALLLRLWVIMVKSMFHPL